MAAPSLILLQNIVSGTSLERLTTHIAQMPLLVFYSKHMEQGKIKVADAPNTFEVQCHC